MLETLYAENHDKSESNHEFTGRQIFSGIALTIITPTLLWMAIVFGAWLVFSD